jgi:hypothetical protein
MARTRISGFLAAGFLVVGCGGETRTAAENEACFGAAPGAGGAVANTELGMPSAEADLEAWVIREQGGMLQVSTQPCVQRPPAKLLVVLPDARVMARGGETLSFRDLKPGMKVSVWYLGGSKGKARAVVVDRTDSWPPGGAPTPTPEILPPEDATPGAAATATPAP